MASEWEAAGYVTSSKYRRDVIEHLHEHGSAIPSEIAGTTDHALPHVSRALGQLREEGLVELLVPEERRRGRLYGLTPQGATAVERLIRNERGRQYDIVPVEECDHPDLIEFLEEEYGGAIRAVSCVSDEFVEVAFLSEEVRHRYTEREIENMLVELDLLGRASASSELGEAIGEHQFAVHGFDRAMLFCLFLPDENVVVSAEPDLEVAVPAFAQACLERLDAN